MKRVVHNEGREGNEELVTGRKQVCKSCQNEKFKMDAEKVLDRLDIRPRLESLGWLCVLGQVCLLRGGCVMAR